MSDNLRAVWQQVEQLLDQGINLIPVRDKDTIYKGKLYEAKTPYAEWKTYQYERIDRAVLFHDMAERYNTTAVAMVCGAISGNLEVIDFDVKYKPGIDATVLHAINDMYPDILAKMRVHKTRSGGTHLVYRIADKEVPGSTHLAERPATQEELDADTSKNKKKSRCFIETRGTGGLATAPPSLGYSIRKDIPVQTITWEERCSIVEMCRAYNEYFPEEKPYTPPKSEQDYYDENPFEHYNRTVDPRELLEQYGWTFVRQHGRFIWFTRPGGKANEVHGGFNTERHTFRVWGTKADLDSERSYTPSTILAHYAYNGDKSACYAYLVQKGYGKIKPKMEAKIAAKHARNNTAMPANASAIAIEAFNRHVEQAKVDYPHGIYWEEDDEGKIVVSRLKLKNVAEALGFRMYNEEVVQIVEQFIHRRDLRYFYDALRAYIKQDEEPALYEEIFNAIDAFIEKHGKWASTQLLHLDAANILQDTRAECYKFYSNGCVYITAHGYALIQYTAIADKLIWHEKVQQREFCTTPPTGPGLYGDFLDRACNFNKNKEHIMRVVGWLAHDYKDSSTGYIITLVEECEDPKDGGGSGKNLFCELLKNTTTVCVVAAAQKKENINIFQSWEGERVLLFSDPKKDFDFEVLKEPSTGTATIKKLFKNERNATNKELPKLIVATQFSFEISDGGLRRRIISIEFTDFFTKQNGVRSFYKKGFPDDWESNDWNEFDHLICESISLWLASDLTLTSVQLTESGWYKQFDQTYGQVITEFIKEKWEVFSKGNFITNQTFNESLIAWMMENNYNTNKKPTTFRLNKALDEWCKKHKYWMDKEEVQKIDDVTYRGRKFYNLLDDPAPF